MRRMTDFKPALGLPPRLPDEPGRRLFVVGAGKAAAAMARVVEEHYSRDLRGLVVTRYGHTVACERIEVIEAGHPAPDGSGGLAARHILDLVGTAGEGDTVIVLISGGASALLPLPLDGITLTEKQDITWLRRTAAECRSRRRSVRPPTFSTMLRPKGSRDTPRVFRDRWPQAGS
jgi:glycerate 2-kinase